MGDRLFCFGLGYTARVLARELKAEGFAVAGTTREESAAEALRREGIEVHIFSRERPLEDPCAVLKGTTHLLNSVPPDETGDPVLQCHGTNIIGQATTLRWAGYLSTTGVYGDRGGAWVDEDTAVRPTTERGHRRVTAEAEWLDLWWEDGLPVHVFRLAGIYGPGRNALDELRMGRAKRVVKDGQVFSRVHVADIVSVLCASMRQPNPGRIYNVCDDLPAPPQEVIAFAAGLLGQDPPPEIPFERAELSDMAKSFYAENKRVRNNRIKQELGVALRYPDYHAGLRALLDGQ
jgi:nucleoside-diphosphate-sugar epimerase